ncbi:AAA family ATPase [Patescibacteria group bacterium]|nr:AAA family ATPase [Patescibacteria group bacterium]
MKDIIIIHGAPGTGKTSACLELQKQLDYPPYLELDRLRRFHMDPAWLNVSSKDEEMGLLNMISMTKNYSDNGYHNIIVSHLKEFQLTRFIEHFTNQNYVIISLVVSDDQVLKKRVLTETRDSGFRDYREAIQRNKDIKSRKPYVHEIRLDNTRNSPSQTVKQIMEYIKQ